MDTLNLFYSDLKKILKSRTVLTLLLLTVINLQDAFTSILDMNQLIAINVILSTAAKYFRIDAKQTYGDNT